MTTHGSGQSPKPLAEGISLDDFLPYLLNRISNRLNSDLSDDLRRMGLTLPDWRVLAVLHVRDGRTLGELSVYTVIEQSTLSRIVVRMARAGYVERRPAEHDGRIVQVLLAPAGREAFARILPVAMRHYRRAVQGLGEDELGQLIATLHRILGNIRSSGYP